MDLVVDNGKPVEPSATKKIIAKVTRDTDAVLVLPWEEVQAIVGNHLYNGASWLTKYKCFDVTYNMADESVTINFHNYAAR